MDNLPDPASITVTPEITAVEGVMMKYLNPKKEFDHIAPKVIASEIITALAAAK